MSDHSHKRTGWSRIRPAHWIALILVVLAIVFVMQNRGAVSIDLFWISVASPLWLTLVLMFAVGWLSGYLTAGRAETARTAKRGQT